MATAMCMQWSSQLNRKCGPYSDVSRDAFYHVFFGNFFRKFAIYFYPKNGVYSTQWFDSIWVFIAIAFTEIFFIQPQVIRTHINSELG